MRAQSLGQVVLFVVSLLQDDTSLTEHVLGVCVCVCVDTTVPSVNALGHGLAG